MKTKNLLSALLISIVLAVPVAAGDIDTPGKGPNNPPCTPGATCRMAVTSPSTSSNHDPLSEIDFTVGSLILVVMRNLFTL